jgi:hypothetical protein
VEVANVSFSSSSLSKSRPLPEQLRLPDLTPVGLMSLELRPPGKVNEADDGTGPVSWQLRNDLVLFGRPEIKTKTLWVFQFNN